MRKFTSLLICILIIIASFSAVFSVGVSAKSADISLSSSTVRVGDIVSVTVVCAPNNDIFSAVSTLTYDEDLVAYVSGATREGDSSVIIEDNQPGTQLRTYEVSFKAVSEGTASFLLKITAIKPDNKKGTSTAKAKLTIKENVSAPISTIDSISVSDGRLVPKFVNAITDYTVTVPFTTDKITLTAECSDNATKISGAGQMRLKVGENNKSITSSANGKNVVYHFKIKRMTKEETDALEAERLENLNILIDEELYTVNHSITGITIPNGFSIKTLEYNGVNVEVITDKKGIYTLYSIKANEGNSSDWYYLNKSDEFVKLTYVVSNGVYYIVDTPKKLNQNEKSWYPTEIKLNSTDSKKVRAYKSSDDRLKDIVVVYCYVNGNYGYYRYDCVNKTIQIAPDFISAEKSEGNTEIKGGNIFTNFMYISNSGKVILTLSAIEILLLILITIMLIRSIIQNRANPVEKLDRIEDLEAEELLEQQTKENKAKPEPKPQSENKPKKAQNHNPNNNKKNTGKKHNQKKK